MLEFDSIILITLYTILRTNAGTVDKIMDNLKEEHIIINKEELLKLLESFYRCGFLGKWKNGENGMEGFSVNFTKN